MFCAQRVIFTIAFLLLALTGCVADQGQWVIDNNDSSKTIQSARALEIYLQTTSNSPIHRLSAAAERRFLDSLVFTKNGLGSYGYYELEALSPSEAYAILRLFGMEDTTQLINEVPAGDPDHRVLRQREVEEGKDLMCDGSRCYVSPGNYCTRSCG